MAQAVDPSSIRVALLAGGTSGEREISLASVEGAGEALRAAGFIVEAFDPASREDLKKLRRCVSLSSRQGGRGRVPPRFPRDDWASLHRAGGVGERDGDEQSQV